METARGLSVLIELKTKFEGKKQTNLENKAELYRSTEEAGYGIWGSSDGVRSQAPEKGPKMD